MREGVTVLYSGKHENGKRGMIRSYARLQATCYANLNKAENGIPLAIYAPSSRSDTPNSGSRCPNLGSALPFYDSGIPNINRAHVTTTISDVSDTD
jgi:hypothetical protein